jgi:hypothetical protein
MTPHGPDTATFERAVAAEAEQPAHLGRDTLAFMFETSMTPRVTPAALGATNIDRWGVGVLGGGGACGKGRRWWLREGCCCVWQRLSWTP